MAERESGGVWDGREGECGAKHNPYSLYTYFLFPFLGPDSWFRQVLLLSPH